MTAPVAEPDLARGAGGAYGAGEPAWRRPLAWTVALGALGVFLVSLAYALSRSAVPGSSVPYWAGETVFYGAFVAHAVRRPSLGAREGTVAVAAVAVLSFALKWFYSPLKLKFIDELLHEHNTQTVLDTGRLGGTNAGLPISMKYPGLQAVGGSLARASGLSANTVGFIVAGVLHVAFLIALYLLFATLSDNPRLALLGVLLYAASDGFAMFSSFYVYENLAFPFALTSLYLFLTATRRQPGTGLTFIGAYLAFLVTMVSHHVTVIFLAVMIVLVAATTVVLRFRSSLPSVAFALVTSATLGAWLYTGARGTTDYLAPYTVDAGQSKDIVLTSPADTRAPTAVAPSLEHALSVASVVLLSLAIALGSLAVLLRRRQRRPWNLAFALLAVTFPLVLYGAQSVATGQSSGGRATAFIVVGGAFVASGFLVNHFALFPRRVPTVLAFLVAVLIMLGGLSRGWQPWWEKTPRAYVPKGYESAVDARDLAAARWVRAHTSPDATFATDFNGQQVVFSIGDRYTADISGTVFYSNTVTQARAALKASGSDYVWVDRRLASVRSPSQSYLASSAGSLYNYPPTVAQLYRFTHLPRVGLVYDDGVIEIYDVSEAY